MKYLAKTIQKLTELKILKINFDGNMLGGKP